MAAQHYAATICCVYERPSVKTSLKMPKDLRKRPSALFLLLPPPHPHCCIGKTARVSRSRTMCRLGSMSTLIGLGIAIICSSASVVVSAFQTPHLGTKSNRWAAHKVSRTAQCLQQHQRRVAHGSRHTASGVGRTPTKTQRYVSGSPAVDLGDVDDHSNTSQSTTGPSFLTTLWRFTRPHTLIGSAIAIPSIFLLASPTYASFFEARSLASLLYAAVPSLLMNLYITGLNQITDVEIDKINVSFCICPTRAWNLTDPLLKSK